MHQTGEIWTEKAADDSHRHHIGLLTATITELCPEVSPAEIIQHETELRHVVT
jgi:hypothetical protein